ncbi:uncharacterized protein si:ch211-243a20.4 [Xiphias gladius]|uniref:uncharacterized protein si:ch211-243a20.4 n=1 Tax=Xiphias gladius TaxID=8245 RepID=UPI001A9879A5|nr:uncharacterized protein si:ch211-243a20.4 [Xiphias gladius]
MEFQRFFHLSCMLTWIFVFFLPSVCRRMAAPKISLNTTVFVALVGESLTIGCVVMKPANQSTDKLNCWDPHDKLIYTVEFPATAGQKQKHELQLKLQNLAISGEYMCEYDRVQVYWFIQVRGNGYMEPQKHYTELIILAIFTAVLLVFSVVGSVYVFRGHWKEQITECGKAGTKQKQNVEERKAGGEGEMEEDNVDVITSPSTSFYAALEPRPRSIYDVLDRSAANREPDQGEQKPKNEPQKTTEQIPQHQDEGVFESVYENF